jgi:predicted DNA-binding transcriptional regulator YafY
VRASRLVSILLLLQTRGRMTAQDLADELEVSVRTIYRDVDSLAAAGVPLYGDRGPAGGYQLLDGYRTRLTGLTADEAGSLFLAGMPGPAAELGLGTVLATAQLKLLAAIPPELRSQAGRIRERFHLDAPGWYAGAEQPEYLAAVADAVWSQRAIRVHYRRWGGQVHRTLEPLGVVLKGGVWYLVANARDEPVDDAEQAAGTPEQATRASGQPRTYRVARILELEPLADHFERPASFDLAAFWESWSDEFLERRYRAEVVVRLSPRGLELLRVLSDPMTARRVVESAGPPDADSWVQAVLPVESIRHAEVELLRLGADAEVLAPPELRARMAETAAALATVYRSS